jgi:hypothetical protein
VCICDVGGAALLQDCTAWIGGFCSGQPCDYADAAPVLPILRYLADRPWLHDELDVVVEGLGKAVVWAPDRSEVRVVGCDQRVLAVVKIAGRSPANHTLDQDWLFFQHGPPMHGVGGGMGGMY